MMQELSKLMQARFDKMCATGKLFRAGVPGQKLWELYLESFPEGEDPVFRDPASTTHNCNLCGNFIRRYGNIVAVDGDYNVMSVFDVAAGDKYRASMEAMAKAVRSAAVEDVFFETYDSLNELPYESCSRKAERFQLGLAVNHKQYTEDEAYKFGPVSPVRPGEVRAFHHMNLSLPKAYVSMTGDSIESISAKFKDAKAVFARAMSEIPADTLALVVDLINQGSLLNGDAHLEKVERVLELKRQYDELAPSQRDNWCWVTSFNLPYAKFKNELIGVLCSELAEGKDLTEACKAWNIRVDPKNYMKATAPITKRQIDAARQFVEENGYAESFDRRFATIDDIRIEEIKHINNGDGTVKSVSVFDGVKATPTRHRRAEFDGVEEVHIDKFMKDILPKCTGVEAFLQNGMEGNMVTLTTANKPDSKPIFKWSNNYSWTFNGNLAGKSEIKEAVKAQGGKVDGVLRFSIMWAENDQADNSDLDAWAQEPNGTKIGYSTPYRRDRGIGSERTMMSGQLDVDITTPSSYGHKNIVENIVWSDLARMSPGVYRVWVNQFADRGSKGFRAEVEFDGETYTYEYDRRVSGNVPVAEVTLDKDMRFSIKHLLPESSVTSREIYGLSTNEFHRVRLVCLSPNHWGDDAVGNKHYMFMLEGCVAPGSVRSFHNENLRADLLEHRKVMEVLGASTMVPKSDKQLSGLGFNATVRADLTVRISGTHKRVLKIKF